MTLVTLSTVLDTLFTVLDITTSACLYTAPQPYVERLSIAETASPALSTSEPAPPFAHRTSRSLRERQRDPREDRPGRLDRRVVEVDLEEVELLVEQIRRSHRDETVPLRQTVGDRRIDGPEVIATGPKGTVGSRKAVNVPS